MARIRGHRRRAGADWAAVCPSTGDWVVGELANKPTSIASLVPSSELPIDLHHLPPAERFFRCPLKYRNRSDDSAYSCLGASSTLKTASLTSERPPAKSSNKLLQYFILSWNLPALDYVPVRAWVAIFILGICFIRAYVGSVGARIPAAGGPQTAAASRNSERPGPAV
jgi:hypothetical protein